MVKKRRLIKQIGKILKDINVTTLYLDIVL